MDKNEKGITKFTWNSNEISSLFLHHISVWNCIFCYDCA